MRIKSQESTTWNQAEQTSNKKMSEDKKVAIIAQMDKIFSVVDEGESDFEDYYDETNLLLEQLKESGDAIAPVFSLIEKYPDCYYGAPGIIGHYLEQFYHNGYEEALVNSIKKEPNLFTLLLLQRILADKDNPKWETYYKLMQSLTDASKYDGYIVSEARENVIFYKK